MDFLVRKILEKEPAAILLAKEAGSFASDEISTLADHEDAGVRQIAVRALNQIGGSGAAPIFVRALLDDSPSVRAAALNALENHLNDESYPQLLQVYERISDPQHRQEIALLLGNMSRADLNDLKRAFENERNPEAVEGCLAALAKLGEPNAQAEFLNRLRNARDRRLKRFLQYVEYIRQTWTLPGLIPALNDRMPLVGIAVCPLPEGRPEYLRACDMAVNLIAGIAGARFSFPVDGTQNYTDEQLAEARRLLDFLP